MKIFLTRNQRAHGVDAANSPSGAVSRGARRSAPSAAGTSRGFTMMEIAISLAIIGIALVAIMGVLPIGMNAQQDNRQETVIGQDASVLMEDIRNGALGGYDLTNYVYAITNSWMEFAPAKNAVVSSGVNGYTYANATVANAYPTFPSAQPLTNNANIIGLLTTPEFTDTFGNPTANLYTDTYCSNHVVAYVYSISGPAYEKPPQDNSLMQQSSFGYRLYCVNTGEAVNTNIFFTDVPNYNQQMLSAIHELRLTFEWPQLANGNLGPGRQTFRTLVAGQLVRQPLLSLAAQSVSPVAFNHNLYVYQSQSFTNSFVP